MNATDQAQPDPAARRCIQPGERLGLYKNYAVSKGCTSPYLPLWIESVVGKKAMVDEA